MRGSTNRGLSTIFVFCCIGFFSCATIIKGSSPNAIKFQSKPDGAVCNVYDNVTGERVTSVTTPGTAMLPKSNGYFKYAKYRIDCGMENKPSQIGCVEGYANGWYIGGNLIFGGLIGYLIVDPASGAMWTLEPDTLVVDFEDPIKSKLAKTSTNDNTTVTE